MNAMVRRYGLIYNDVFEKAWKCIYHDLLYKHSDNLKKQKTENASKKPRAHTKTGTHSGDSIPFPGSRKG